MFIMMLFFYAVSNAQPLTGIKTINPSGGDYTSVGAAIADLNSKGVGTGGVTFELPSGAIFNEKDSLVITATGTASNPIVFRKTGSGRNPIIAADYSGMWPLGSATSTAFLAAGDAVIKLVGTSFITFDGLTIRDALGKSTNREKMEYGIYFAKTTSTNVPTYAIACKNVNILNCQFILDKNNPNSTGIYSSNRETQGRAAVLPPTLTDISGNVSDVRIAGCSFNNLYHGIVFEGPVNPLAQTATSTAELTSQRKDRNINIGPAVINAVNYAGNTINNYGGGSAVAYAIYLNNLQDVTVNTNTFLGGQFTTGVLYGVFSTGGFNTNLNVTNNTFSLKGMLASTIAVQVQSGGGSTTTSFTAGTAPSYYFASGVLTNTINITGNQFVGNNPDNASPFTAIVHQTGIPNTLNISNNIFTSNVKTGRSGLTFINVSSRGRTTNINNNIIRDNKIIADLSSTAGTSITGINLGTPPAFSTTATPLQAPTVLNANNNIIRNNGIEFVGQTTSAGTITGFTTNFPSQTRARFIFTNNTVRGLYITGNSSATNTITGASLTNALSNTSAVPTIAPLSVAVIRNNTVDSIRASFAPAQGAPTNTVAGSANLLGMTISTSDTIYFNNNTIRNLSTTGITSTARGLTTTSGYVVQIYNNLITELYATQTRSTQNSAVTGMDLASSSTNSRVIASNNTVYLDNNSTDTVGSYRSSAVYSVSGSNSIRLVNNIFVNRSRGNSRSVHVAHMRSSSDFTNMRTTGFLSGRNIYRATGAANTGRYLVYFGIGSTLDSAFNLNTYQSLATPADTSSFGEDVPFVNTSTLPYDLNLQTTVATFAANRGLPVTFTGAERVGVDFTGSARSSTTPDIGAYEGAYTFKNLDDNLPIITFTPVVSPSATASAALTANIVDWGSNVNVTTFKPRLYYRKLKRATANADNFYSTNDNTTGGWKFVETSSATGPNFNFTVDVNKLQSYVQGDSIEYFLIAQDNAGNIASNRLAQFNTVPTNIDLAAANFPVRGTFNLYRTSAPFPTNVTVGAIGGNYTSFTQVGGLFEAINSSSISGNINVSVVSNTEENGAVDLTNTAFNSGTFRINIRPAGAFEDTIKSINASLTQAMIEFVGAKKIFIDGSHNGQGNYLIFTNTSNSPNIRFSATTTSSSDSIVIRNCTFIGGTTNQTSGYGILATGSVAGYTTLTNARHRNFVITDNIFKRINTGIYLANVDATSRFSGLQIRNNIFGASESPIRTTAIFTAFARNAAITGNTIEHLYNPSTFNTVIGIQAQGADTVLIQNNTITNRNVTVAYPSTSFVGIELIHFATGSVPTTRARVINNNINTFRSSGSTTVGIRVNTNTRNSFIGYNNINNLIYNGTAGYSGVGIIVGSTGTPIPTIDTIFGNMISRVTGDGWSTIALGGSCGIDLRSGDSLHVFNNSVHLYGPNNRNGTNLSACLNIESSVTKLYVRNNIFVNKLINSQGSANASNSKHFAIVSAAPFAELRRINNNVYFTDLAGQGWVSRIRSATQTATTFTEYRSLGAHNFNTRLDSQSFFVEPTFVDTLDLHIASSGLPTVLESKGFVLSSARARDIDNDVRPGPVGSTNGGGTAWDIGVDEFDGIPDNSDRTAPALSYVSITPPVGQCAPSAHTVKVLAADASGIDTVRIEYSVNGVRQNNIVMNPTTPANNYEGVIPAQAPGATVRFRVVAIDFSTNRNTFSIGGLSSADSSFSDAEFNINAVSQFDTIAQGSSSILSSTIADKRVGNGSLTYAYTDGSNIFDRYWGGRKVQYLYTANELLAAGLRPGKITKIEFEVGINAPRIPTLPGFRVEMSQTGQTAAGNTFATGSVAVNNVPPAGYKPVVKNGRISIPIPAANQITWDGTSSIAVILLWSVGDGGTAFTDTSQTIRLRYATTATPSVTFTQADNQNQAFFINATTGSISSLRPNIIFGNDYAFTNVWSAVNPTGAGLPTTLNTKNITVRPTAAGTYSYIAAGSYLFNNQTCTINDTVNLVVLPTFTPVAAFVNSDSSVLVGSDATPIEFTDLSTNFPNRWKWTITPSTYTYADGTTAPRFEYISSTDTAKNPTVLFRFPGTYSVKLRSINTAGSDSVTKVNLIRVDSSYCIPVYTTNNSTYAITRVRLKNLRTTSSSIPPYYVNYGDSAVAVPQLNIGTRDSIVIKGTNTFSQVAVWFDFNANSTFDANELVGRAPIPAGLDSNIIYFTVPQNSALGRVRMRVVSYYSSDNPSPCSPYFGLWGETEDYVVQILPNPNMAITSTGAVQNTQLVSVGALNQQVLRFTVNTTGSANAFRLSRLKLNLAGTTNNADIRRVRVYSTGTSNVFSADSLFASTTSISSAMDLIGTSPKGLVTGANNFWITVDVANNATIGNSIDVSVDSISYRTPSTVPPGFTITNIATPDGTATGARLIQSQMAVTGDQISQPITISVTPGTTNNALMLIKLTTTTGSPANLVSFKFTSTGSTNANADIQGARLYYTGATTAFNTDVQYGATITNVRDTMEFQSVQSLLAGDNYFWLSYDLRPGANVGNFIDGAYFGYITQGTYDYSTTVTVSNPSGNRQLDSANCVSNATNATGDDIALVRIGNISRQSQALSPVFNRADANQTYNNFTTLAPFVMQRAIKTPIEVRTINSNFSLTQNRVSIYIDLNNNRQFENAELLLSKVIAATVNEKVLIDTIRVPFMTPNGFYRLRVIVSGVTASAQAGCGTYTTGETEDYLIQLVTPPPGDYFNPIFSNATITPSGNQCVAVPKLITVNVTDTTGLDTVWLDWKLNGVTQTPRVMVRGAGDSYSTTIPPHKTMPVEYSFRAKDFGTPYRNIGTAPGDRYEDEYLQISAGNDKFIKVGDTTSITASSKSLSNLLFTDIVQFYLSVDGEVYPPYLPPTVDNDFIEITNISTSSVNLSGHIVQILGNPNHTFTFPNGVVVPSRGTVLLGFLGTQTDFVNNYYGMGMTTTTSSGVAHGYVLRSPSGVVLDVVATNGYTFNPSTGVTTSDWSGNIPNSSGRSGVARVQTGDNNAASDWVLSNVVNVTPGVFNPTLSVVPASVTVTWNGGVLTAPRVSTTLNTPVHPNAGAFAYTSTLTDNTCSDIDTVVVNVLAKPVVNIGVDGSICQGSRILDAGAHPFARYTWSTGETTRSITVNSPGLYWVLVRDSANNITRDSIDLVPGPAFNVSVGADRDLCIGGNITINTTVTGAPATSYLWSNGATTPNLSVNAAGTYSVIVTNAGGCQSFDTVVVTSLQTNPTVDLGADQTICKSSPIVLDAGNPGSTYTWSTGATTKTISVSNAGTYSVIVNTPTGCTLNDTIVISNLPAPTVSLGSDVEICPGTSTTLDAGNAGLTYLWSTGATTQTISVTNAGNYWVAVTGTNGCSTSDTVVVSSKVAPVVNLGLDRDICTSDSVTLDAGNVGSTYLWSTGATTRTIRVSLAGTYSVAVTNAGGCTTTDAVVITNKPTPNSAFTSQAVAPELGQQIQFTSTPGAGNQYSWNFGDPSSASNTSLLPSPIHVFSAPGQYTVTLTVTNVSTGCKSVTTSIITVTTVGNDFAKIFNLYAAPNPFVGNTKIKYTLPENANNVSIDVYDMIGRKVSTIATNESQDAGTYEFNFENTDTENASGVYMVKLIVDGKVAITRVIDIAKR